jgi:hypothetical protein
LSKGIGGQDMGDLQTILGTDIPITTRGVIYLCKFSYEPLKIEVIHEILCDKTYQALDLYANIPNPESQIVMGNSFEELIVLLHQLHRDMKDPVWLEELSQQL